MAVVVFDKSIQLSDVERITKAQILHALKCVDANSSFQLVNDEGKQFCLMLPDSQIAICYKLKWNIQFGIALCFREQLKDDLKNIPFSFKFDVKLRHNKPKNNTISTPNIGEKNINVSRYCTMALSYSTNEKLLEHFFEFVRKANFDLYFVLDTREWMVLM